ncbi:MAG: peptidase [Allosphingosinicella sp.]
MTYCLGMLLDDGLVMVADTRTNAGVDNVSSYRKLHCLVHDAEREVHVATSGNLSASQATLARLAAAAGDPVASLAAAGSMFEIAVRVGEALRQANHATAELLAPTMKGTSSMLLGGRVGAEPPRLFQIYPEGNFIECRPEAPFFQIGETKYGRPILDRVIRRTTPLPAAIKTALLSFDSAMRSNLSVARPLDLIVMPAAGEPTMAKRIEADDPYFNTLSTRWSQALNEAAAAMPDPDFMTPSGLPHAPLLVARIRG